MIADVYADVALCGVGETSNSWLVYAVCFLRSASGRGHFDGIRVNVITVPVARPGVHVSAVAIGPRGERLGPSPSAERAERLLWNLLADAFDGWADFESKRARSAQPLNNETKKEA